MKIGIITLSASDNCGSLLQAYALKRLLEKYGDVEVINFSSEKSHVMYDVYPKGESLIRHILLSKRRKSIEHGKVGYETFRRDFLNMYGREYFSNDLYLVKDLYDVVVVGSDQVWNVQMGDFDEAFFCGWTNTKKVAYAPSLGGYHLKLSPNYTNIKKWVNSFDYLSVREEIGKKCLEEVTNKKVEKVLDPTLVIDEEIWEQIVGKPLIDGDYIFYYSWAYCEDETSQIVAEESKRVGMPVYVIDPRKWLNRNLNKWGFNLYAETGPQIFLNLMKYAKRCYVESFHGMVFAYIFRKNFWLLDTHNNMEDLDSRLMEFINLLGAQDRILTKYNVQDIDQSAPKKYENSDSLELLKLKSHNYLDRALGNE